MVSKSIRSRTSPSNGELDDLIFLRVELEAAAKHPGMHTGSAPFKTIDLQHKAAKLLPRPRPDVLMPRLGLASVSMLWPLPRIGLVSSALPRLGTSK